MQVGGDLDWQTIKKTLLRLSPKGYAKRPNYIAPQDHTRTSEEKNE